MTLSANSGVAVGSGGGGGVACGSDSRELREVSDANSRPRVRQINDAAASSLAPASMVWFPARHKVGTATSTPQLLMPLLTALARLHRKFLGQRTSPVQVMAPVRICQPQANTGVQDARSTGTTQQFGLSWQVSLQHPSVTYDETQHLNVTCRNILMQLARISGRACALGMHIRVLFSYFDLF